VLDADGALRDLSDIVADINGSTLSPAGLAKIAGANPERLPAVRRRPRIGCPVAGIGKFICHRPELRRPRGRVGPADPRRAGGVHQGDLGCIQGPV
jgi:2,4-diketo-3-deoxy-L-fuconate hydrolase